MYNLTYLESDQMKLTVDNRVVFVGDGSEAVNILVRQYGFCKKELFLAFQVLLDNPEDNNMHFGITGGFIFTNQMAA